MSFSLQNEPVLLMASFVVVQQDLAAMNEPVLLMASFVVVQQDLAS
jgi:hypothetical protein